MMQAKTRWVGKMAYQADSRGHRAVLDAKKEFGGMDIGMSPKEMVLNGLCGCSGMDVISLLTGKFKLPVTALEISADAESTTSGHPVVWTKVDLSFEVSGDLPADQVIKAVDLSMTKYCGVSAMLVKAVPIQYKVLLNGEQIHTGIAKF